MSGATDAVVAAIGWALVHFFWQGAGIGLATAFALRLLRRARPHARYAVACAALILCVSLPGVGVVRNLPGRAAVSTSQMLRANVEPRSAPVLVVPAPSRSMSSGVDASVRPYLPLVVGAWAAGAMLLALRLAAGVAWASRLSRREAEPAEARWVSQLAALARRMNIARNLALRVSRAVETPLAIGWWRPVILLPASLVTGMAPSLLEALLAHELAHIRRHDYVVNLLQSVAEILLFYHPAVWWISHAIRNEREQIADDLAASALGEPRRLALALQALDRLQIALPQSVQAAHGGSLMNRIRRLVRPEPRPIAWKTALCVLALTAVCATSVAFSAHSGPSSAGPTAFVGRPGSSPADQEELTGTWQLKTQPRSGESIHIQFRRAGASGDTWGISLRPGELAGLDVTLLTQDGPARFELRREAGLVRFEGRFQRGEGSGDFRFTPSAEYVAAMKALGYGGLTIEKVFALAIVDVTRQFVQDLKGAGYAQIALDDVMACRIHGATAAFAKSMRDLLGHLPVVNDLVAMRIHEVTPEFAKQMQGLLGKVPTGDHLVAMRIHEVTPEFASAMRGLLGRELTVDQLVAFRIHNITPEFTKQMQGLLGKVPTGDHLVAMRIHEVTPEFASAVRGLLGGDLTVDQLVAFRIHGVSPEFVRAVKELGYDRVTPDQLVAMCIHGVDPDFIRKARQGGKNPSIDELIEMRIRGVRDPA